MVHDDFDIFKSEAMSAGADEALIRDWAPNTEAAVHTHPFEAHAVVAQGEMWLTRGSETRHLRKGDEFRLAPGEPHAERYGPDGAVYWVARKNVLAAG